MMSKYSSAAGVVPRHFGTLWEVLTTAARHATKVREVVFIVDALDEREELGRSQLAKALVKFHKQGQPEGSTAVKFLVTARPYPDIEQHFEVLRQGAPTIRIPGEEESEQISKEIDLVIRTRVPEIAVKHNLDSDQISVFEEGLLGMKHRTYLWLTLVLGIIETEVALTAGTMRQVIDNLPQDVEAAYERILSKVRTQDHDCVRKLICLIVSAFRPLKQREINIALAVKDDSRNFSKLDILNNKQLDRALDHISGLFVNVVSEKIYLIHQTAKVFLIKDNDNR